MKNEIYLEYLAKMRATMIIGGSNTRKQLIDEMRNLVQQERLSLEDLYKIYFLAMPQMGT